MRMFAHHIIGRVPVRPGLPLAIVSERVAEQRCKGEEGHELVPPFQA
jgi:hypothetical protein